MTETTVKIEPVLMAMPLHIKKEIFGGLDLRNRSRVRKCCKTFQGVIDKMKLQYDRVLLSVYGGEIKMKVFEVIGGKHFRTDVTYDSDDFVEDAIRDLKILFQNPNSEIKEFHVEIWMYFFSFEDEESERKWRFFNQMSQMLGSLGRPKVNEFLMKHQGKQKQTLSILPFLEPGTLESLKIVNCSFENNHVLLNEIVELEHWKKAKTMVTGQLITAEKLEKFYHFESFCVEKWKIEVSDVENVVENAFESPLPTIDWNVTHWGDQKPIIDYLDSRGSPLEDLHYKKWKLMKGETELTVTVCTTNVSNFIVGPGEKHRIIVRR